MSLSNAVDIGAVLTNKHSDRDGGNVLGILLPNYMQVLPKNKVQKALALTSLAMQPMVQGKVPSLAKTQLAKLIFRWENIWQDEISMGEKSEYIYQKILLQARVKLRGERDPLVAINRLRSFNYSQCLSRSTAPSARVSQG